MIIFLKFIKSSLKKMIYPSLSSVFSLEHYQQPAQYHFNLSIHKKKYLIDHYIQRVLIKKFAYILVINIFLKKLQI